MAFEFDSKEIHRITGIIIIVTGIGLIIPTLQGWLLSMFNIPSAIIGAIVLFLGALWYQLA